MATTHEDIVARLVSIMETTLNTVIDELNAQLGPPLLEKPEKIYFGERSLDTLIKTNLNCGSVIADRDEVVNPQDGYYEEDWYFSVAIILRANIRQPVEMEKRAMRMKDALRIAIGRHPYLDFRGDSVVKDFDRESISATPLELHGDLLMKAIIMEIRVRTTVCQTNAW